jgi:hypothetical protein
VRTLKAAPYLESAGSRLLGRFSGVVIVEAMKQVYAFSSGKRARRLVPRLRPVLLPAPQPLGARRLPHPNTRNCLFPLLPPWFMTSAREIESVS